MSLFAHRFLTLADVTDPPMPVAHYDEALALWVDDVSGAPLAVSQALPTRADRDRPMALATFTKTAGGDRDAPAAHLMTKPGGERAKDPTKDQLPWGPLVKS